MEPDLGRRVRPPGKVALLGLATLGFGFAWYYFQAFREVDRDAGRLHSPFFFLSFVPFLGPVFALLYMAKELRGLTESRLAVGIVPGIGAWQHLGFVLFGVAVAAGLAWLAWLPLREPMGEEAWIVPAIILGWLSLAFSAPMLAPTVNGYWEARINGAPPPPSPGPDAPALA